MVLKSLILQGFKSFPDRTEIKFLGGITAIVGPNGSGNRIFRMPSGGFWGSSPRGLCAARRWRT